MQNKMSLVKLGLMARNTEALALAVSELMALYRFTVIGLHWQAAQKKKKEKRLRFYNILS